MKESFLSVKIGLTHSASVGEFRNVPVKISLTHFGSGFSASVGEFRNVPVKISLTHFGSGFSASVGEFRNVNPFLKIGLTHFGGGFSASVDEFRNVPDKIPHSFWRWFISLQRSRQKRIIPFRQNRPHSFWRWFFSLGRLMEWLQLCCYKRLSLLKLKIII